MVTKKIVDNSTVKAERLQTLLETYDITDLVAKVLNAYSELGIIVDEENVLHVKSAFDALDQVMFVLDAITDDE